jgi:DNA invertase Pin-like site-specific DNA recombinase
MDAKPTGKLIGYARVSTQEQKLRLQLDDLERAGCWNIYQEHASASKRRKRPQLELALMDLRPGDTLIVWKLDRLTRNLRELFLILDRIHEAGAGFKSLTEQIDLSTATGRLLLGMFGAFAQFAAELTAERTGAGIRAIQARGLQYGAKPMLSEAKTKALLKMRKSGASRAETARKFKVSPGTVRNYELRAKRRKPR